MTYYIIFIEIVFKKNLKLQLNTYTIINSMKKHTKWGIEYASKI